MKEVGLGRIGNDKFYTSEKVVKICYQNIKDNIDIDKNDLIIEPSAGNGSFIEYIKNLSNNYEFYDIDPENDEIKKQDFLDLDIIKNQVIHVIGNPPFGRQGSLAKKFIKKCSIFADTISFILPKSFKKDSLRKTFPLNFHLISEIDLPDKSFRINDMEHHVPCVFQIWIKRSFERELPLKQVPNNYIFVKKNENPDISFRRVGVYAGRVETSIDEKSEQSHYFIKFLDTKLLDKLDDFKNIKFNLNNTVGPNSISKPELIKEFNKISL